MAESGGGEALLLDRGADPNVATAEGRTPLTEAADQGLLKHVQLLLKHGSDPNKKGKSGMYPIHMAARCGGKAIIAELLAKGADATKKCVTQTGGEGVTARQIAEKSKQSVAAGCLELLPQRACIASRRSAS